jgi:hypothetical protein
VEYILNKLLPDDELNTDNDFHKFIREQVNEDMITPDDSDFTLPELNNIIKQKTTPGFDQINDQLVKIIFEINSSFMLKLFNRCLKLKFFPKIWKISIIKLILKSKDKPKQEVSSYRLISFFTTFWQNSRKINCK